MSKFTVFSVVTLLLLGAFIGLMPEVANQGASDSQKKFPPLVNDWFLPDDIFSYEGTKDSGGEEPLLPAPGFAETSEYMIGSVAVAVVLPESNGNDGMNTENWTATEKSNIKSEIQEGMNWWASVETDAMLSFTYNFTYVDNPVDCDSEFINYGSGNHGAIISFIMGQLGYTAGSAVQRTRAFANDLRDAHGTDWGFVAFIADSAADADGQFPNTIAYAMLGGPYMVMSYDNGAYGIAEMNRVTAHEAGHTFWALDEYASSGCATSDYSGYLNEQNTNCENGGTGTANIMLDNTFTVLSETRGMIGWRDTDADGVMNILDVPPDTTLNAYVPDPTNNGTPTFTGTATVGTIPNQNSMDGAKTDTSINKIAFVEYRIDGGPWLPVNPLDGTWNDDDIESYNFTTAQLFDGTYLIETRAKITVNGVDIYEPPPYGSDTLTIDLGPPVSDVDALPPITTTAPFPVNVTVQFDINGINKVELWYRKDLPSFQLYGTDFVVPWSFSFDPSIVGGEGTYEFYSRAYDNALNYEDAPAANDTWTMVDSEKPTSAVDSLISFSPPSFTITATASDVTSGVDQVELWYSKDFAPYAQYSVDAAPPWSFNFDTALTGGNGFYEFHSIAIDVAGNVENAPIASDTSTTIDSQAPTSSVNPLTTYTTAPSVPISAIASDTLSGVQNVTLWYSKDMTPYQEYGTDTVSPWSFDFDTSTTGGDGHYRFYSRAHDVAGNHEAAPGVNDTWTIVDTVKPSSSADSLSTYAASAVFSVPVTASADPNGIQSVELWYDKDGAGYTLYDTDLSAPWSFSFDSSTTGDDGLYEFYSRAYDWAGNYEDSPLANDTWTIVDTNEPVSNANALPAFKNTQSFNIAVTASDSLSGVDQVELWYTWNAGIATLYGTDTASPWQFSFDTSTTGGDGTYTFYSVAYDSAGNMEAIPGIPDASTIVDTLKPSSSVDGLASYSRLFSFMVNATAWDLNGVSDVELWYRKDSGPWTMFTTDTSSPWVFYFNAASTGEGLYEFHSRAEDNATNYEDAAITPDTSVVIDATPPDITVDSPAENAWLGSGTVDIDWTGTDALSGIEHYEIQLDNTNWIAKGTVSDHAFIGLLEGQHSLSIRAFDNATNDKLITLPFNIDLNPPSLTITSPSNNHKVVSGGSVTVNWLGSDSGAGIDHYEVKLDNGSFVDIGVNNSYQVSDLSDGTHTITIKAVDRSGQSTEKTTSVQFGDGTGGGEDPDGEGFIERFLLDYWWLLLLIVVLIVILILVAALVRRRRRGDTDTEIATVDIKKKPGSGSPPEGE